VFTTAGDGRGINIMRHRADLLGGTLEIKEDPDKGGTKLVCSIPLENKKRAITEGI